MHCCTPYVKFKEVLDKLNTLFNNLPILTPDMTIVGDFNFNSKDVIWIEDDYGDFQAVVKPWRERDNDGDYQERRQASELLDFTSSHSMIQVVNIATRKEEILDLIFSNNPDLIQSIESNPATTTL